MSATASIGIVGGGPAGLSLAKLLDEQGFSRVAVFEASERVGGKSYSIRQGGAVHDMGTCYSTLSYQTTNRWMRRYGIRQRALGRQVMEGAPFMKFVNAEPGGSLVAEAGRYLKARRAFLSDRAPNPDGAEAHAAAAEPFADWLARNDLPRMRRFMLRAFTSIGYGPLEALPTVQALRWATPRLFLTGLLAQLKMPVEGWQKLWEQVADDLDVRRAEPVQHIERGPNGVVIHTPTGPNVFDYLVVTTPVDELAGMMELTADERAIAVGTTWNSYVTTLCRVTDWFRGHAVEAYAEPLGPTAEAGLLLSARRAQAGLHRTADADIYLTGQYGHGLTAEQLADRLHVEVERRGGRFEAVLCQKRWKYFPRYHLEALKDGLLTRMRNAQGANRTWYTGATFSYESVGNIVDFNLRLTSNMQTRLAA